LRPAESNGCAAGGTFEDAVLHALFEVIERDATALWWYGGRPVPRLRLNSQPWKALEQFMASLRGNQDARRHWFLDLTSDIPIPVVAAVSSDQDGRGVICGFCADLDASRAARGAVLEMCQMELSQEIVLLKAAQRGEEALNTVERQDLRLKEELTVEAYPELLSATTGLEHPVTPTMDRAERQSICRSILERRGLAAHVLDITRSDLGIPAARVLVPGLQTMKPDWVTARLHQALIDSGGGPPKLANTLHIM
jgi:ribosomal protein S12 methylthiotransferase accessory factor